MTVLELPVFFFYQQHKHVRPFEAGLLLERNLPDLKQMLKVRVGETDRRQRGRVLERVLAALVLSVEIRS